MTIKNCSHYWLLESPDGAVTSRGVCKLCGATKMFANFLEVGTKASPYDGSKGARHTEKIRWYVEAQ